MQENTKNEVEINGEVVSLDELIESYTKSKSEKSEEKKALTKREHEQALKPYQAELIKLQKHLEENNQKMIILFEGRDAAGKGGTIRRVTRYMNEKHYRIVRLASLPKNRRRNGSTKNTLPTSQEAERSYCSTEAGITVPWWSPCSVSVHKKSMMTS